MFVIPRTKHIASRIFDFPDPFNPCSRINNGQRISVYCYRVEGRIPFVDCSADSITLESIDNQLIDLHRDNKMILVSGSKVRCVLFTRVYAFGRN